MTQQYLVDHTREHLITAAEYAFQKVQGDLVVQILATRDNVTIRACAGGVFKTWLADSCDWDKLAKEAANPILPIIDSVLFRLERQCRVVSGTESGQQSAR